MHLGGLCFELFLFSKRTFYAENVHLFIFKFLILKKVSRAAFIF